MEEKIYKGCDTSEVIEMRKNGIFPDINQNVKNNYKDALDWIYSIWEKESEERTKWNIQFSCNVKKNIVNILINFNSSFDSK